MLNTPIHIIDISIICAYLVGCLIIGFYKSRKITNIAEYTLGGKKFAIVVIVSTIFATDIGAVAVMGSVEKVYAIGLLYAVACLAVPSYWFLMLKIYGENIDQFRGCLSMSDIMGKLYGAAGKWVTNIASILMAIGIIAVEVLAMGYIFNYFLGIPQLSGIVVGMGILIFYSTFGGVRAIAYTDVFQFFVFFIAIPTACIVALDEIGGTSALIEQLPQSHLTVKLTSNNILLFASWIFFNIPATAGVYIQRFLMAKDSKQLAKSLKIITAIQFPFVVITCLIAFIVRATAPDIDPNTAFIYFIEHYLYVGIKGFVIAGMLAVIMSTADSWLNNTGIICAHDICKKLFPSISDKKELSIARLSTVIIGIFAIFIAIAGTGIMELCWFIFNFWAPFMLVPIASGFLGFRTNSKSFIASLIGAAFSTCFVAYIEVEFATISLLFGVIGSAICFFGMHCYQVFTGDIVLAPKVAKVYSVGSIERLFNLGLVRFIQRKFEEQRPQFWPLTVFVVLGCVVPLFFVHGTHDLMIIGAIAVTLCFFLHFLSYFPQKIQDYQSLFWYATLTFCCPFMASYQILANHYQIFWLLNGLFVMIFLGIFVDWLSYLMISVLGITAAYLYHSCSSMGHGEIVVISYTSYFVTYCYVIASVIFKIIKEEPKPKPERKKLLSDTTARDIMEPFVISQVALEALQLILSRRIQVAKDKDEEKLNIKIDRDDYKYLKDMADGMLSLAKRGERTLDMLLISLENKITANDIGTYSMVGCVKEAITDYSLEDTEQIKFTHGKDKDFFFKGSKYYVKHVLFNLIRNSFEYAGQDMIIEICLGKSKAGDNQVYFTDKGPGIDKDKIHNIFAGLRTEGSSETGIGLAFCRMVMDEMGGTIECESEVGKYTTITLTFPPVVFAAGDGKS